MIVNSVLSRIRTKPRGLPGVEDDRLALPRGAVVELDNVEELRNVFGWIDVAFVDGCHDTEFIYNDSRKVLAHMKPGSFLLWHDFHPGLVEKKGWIREVCLGVEKLLAAGLVWGPVLHVRNSWLGIYRVQGGD